MVMVADRAVPGPWSSTLRWLLCLALLANVPLAAGATQSVLTLDGALQAAQVRSRQLPAQEAAARAAREMAVAAGQLPDPTLTLGITNLPIDGPDRFNPTRDFMTMRSIGVMQELTREDKRAARADRFLREAEAAETAWAAALADLQRDTASGWLDVHYGERLRDLLQVRRDEAGRQMEAADAAFRGGSGSLADVVAARTAVARIEDRLHEASRDTASARARLARWIGEHAARPLASPPDLSRTRIPRRGLDTYIERHDPRVAIAGAAEATARADAALASSNRNADWSVEVMYGQRGPTFPDMVSLNLRVPLQWRQGQRQDRELAARLATVEQRQADRDEIVRVRTALADEWLGRWTRNRERIDAFDRTLVPLATDRTAARLAAYRGGSGTLVAVLEARGLETDLQVERLRLERETADLWARLEFLVPTGAAQPIPGIHPETSR